MLCISPLILEKGLREFTCTTLRCKKVLDWMFFLLDLLRCPVSISPFDKPYIFFETEITWNIYWLVFIGSLKFLIVTIKPYAYMIINREIFSSSFHEYILLFVHLSFAINPLLVLCVSLLRTSASAKQINKQNELNGSYQKFYLLSLTTL